MRQAIHILRKDIRHLWIEIAVALLATGVFVFTAAGSPSRWNAPLPRTVAAFLVTFLLPFAWWTLIVRSVHAETLTGDRQFWPTRPYSWRSLLVSKLLFFIIFVNLPLLIAQAIVVKAHDFSPYAELPGLLWSQVLLTVAFVLPVAAIAAVTASIVQFLVIALVTFVLALLLAMRFMMAATFLVGGGWGALEWIHTYYGLLLVGVGAPAVLIWQYSRRQTLLARALAVTTVAVIALGAPISWNRAFAIQSRFSQRHVDASDLHVGLNRKFDWATRARILQDGRVTLHIPLELTGVSDDFTTHTEGLTADIEGAGGAVWRADAEPGRNVSTTGQLITLQTTVDGSFYRRVKDQPVRLRGYLYLTLYGNRRVTKVPFTDRPATVPGMGLCTASAGRERPYFLVCNSVFRPQPDLVTIRFEESRSDTVNAMPRHEVSYSPFPADFEIDPIIPFVTYSTYKGQLEAVTVVTLEPLAHVRAPLAIDGLKLSDYEGPMK